MNHTKEPWEARRDPSYYGIVSEVYAGDKFILGTGGVHSPSELEANTKRIVACVNACAGITNEALEKGLIKCAVENLAQNLPYDDGNFYFDDMKVWEDV
jgi:hypothetical protein